MHSENRFTGVNRVVAMVYFLLRRKLRPIASPTTSVSEGVL